jgi:hypothetical protein
VVSQRSEHAAQIIALRGCRASQQQERLVGRQS